MNKTLFFSTLVCIFCVSASQFLFASNDEEPQPGPEADRCLNKTQDIFFYGCLAPGISRWQINLTHPETNIHRFCCYVYDLADCVRAAVEAPHHCTAEERGAVHEFLFQAVAHIEKGDCAKHQRKTEKCIKLD